MVQRSWYRRSLCTGTISAGKRKSRMRYPEFQGRISHTWECFR
jgi:hypothetical protein